MEKTHKYEDGSTNDILKGAIIKFDFWDWENEPIPEPIPRFKPGIRFEILEEILYWVGEGGFLDNHLIVFAWFTLDRNVTINHRLKWKETRRRSFDYLMS